MSDTQNKFIIFKTLETNLCRGMERCGLQPIDLSAYALAWTLKCPKSSVDACLIGSDSEAMRQTSGSEVTVSRDWSVVSCIIDQIYLSLNLSCLSNLRTTNNYVLYRMNAKEIRHWSLVILQGREVCMEVAVTACLVYSIPFSLAIYGCSME